MEEVMKSGFYAIFLGAIAVFFSLLGFDFLNQWFVVIPLPLGYALLLIGIISILYGSYMIAVSIFDYIIGWRRIQPNEISKQILIALNRKADTTASRNRTLKGYKRHIRVGNIVYKIVIPRGKIGNKTSRVSKYGVLTGTPRYYKRFMKK